jgi:hypothetical protein
VAEVESWLSGGEAGHEEFVAGIYRDVAALARRCGHDIVRDPWRFAARPSKKTDATSYVFGEPGSPTSSIMRYCPSSRTFSVVEDEVSRAGVDGLEGVVERTVSEWRRTKDAPRDPGAFRWLQWMRHECPDLALCCAHGTLLIPPREEWLLAVALRQDLVEAWLDVQVEQALRDIPALKACGVDFLNAGGDLASNAGPMYSPRVFREIVLPRLRKIVAACHAHGLWYIFRTDGRLWDISDDLFVASGVDGYGEIDIAAGMDPLEVGRRYPGLVISGAVECGELLTLGTPRAVYEETRRQVEGLKPGGRHLLATSNSVGFMVPAQNYLAMLRAGRDFGSFR